MRRISSASDDLRLGGGAAICVWWVGTGGASGAKLAGDRAAAELQPCARVWRDVAHHIEGIGRVALIVDGRPRLIIDDLCKSRCALPCHGVATRRQRCCVTTSTSPPLRHHLYVTLRQRCCVTTSTSPPLRHHLCVTISQCHTIGFTSIASSERSVMRGMLMAL